MLTVHPSLPVNSVQDLVRLAKAKPRYLVEHSAKYAKLVKATGMRID
jgi:hypothetical protein